jgi:hypothetical protein
VARAVFYRLSVNRPVDPHHHYQFAMPLTPFEAAFMLHLIADWLLQNEWMAVNKVRLSHPAAWVHGGIHAILLGLVVGWAGGITLGLLHMLVDTRVPVRWLIKHFKKCEDSPDLPILLIGCDQVLHLTCLAGWMVLAGYWK